MLFRSKPGQFQVMSTREGIEFIKTPTPEEKATAIKQKTEASTAMTEADAQKKKAEKNAATLTERRNELLRRDLGYMQRYSNAGFNDYERAKIDLERKHIEQREELRDKGFQNVPLGPRLTREEANKRAKEIWDQHTAERDEIINRMQETRDKKMRHGRRLTDKEVEGFRQEEKDADQRFLDRRAKLKKEFEEGPGTLLDPAMKALKTAQGRERALLALEYSNKGQTPGHFTSIEGGYKDFASRINDKGNDIAQKTADNTKGTQDAVRDLITIMKDFKPGIGP